MDLDLKNKVAIVTGGALGLGRAIAMELMREGAKLAIVDINQQQAEKVAAEIRAAGGDFHITDRYAEAMSRRPGIAA